MRRGEGEEWLEVRIVEDPAGGRGGCDRGGGATGRQGGILRLHSSCRGGGLGGGKLCLLSSWRGRRTGGGWDSLWLR